MVLFIPRPLGIISRRPCPRVCPGGTLPSGHVRKRPLGLHFFLLTLKSLYIRRYSSCHYPQAKLRVKRKVEIQTYGWTGDTKDERESHGCYGRMRLVGDDAAASCPMRRGVGFLPDAVRRRLRYHLVSKVLCTDGEGWRLSTFRNIEQDVANQGRM